MQCGLTALLMDGKQPKGCQGQGKTVTSASSSLNNSFRMKRCSSKNHLHDRFQHFPPEERRKRDLQPYLYLPEVKDGSWEKPGSSVNSTAERRNPGASANAGINLPWAVFTRTLLIGDQHQLASPVEEKTVSPRYRSVICLNY